MSITRINTFQAHEGQGDALYDLIASFVPLLRATDGCESCQLLRQTDDPTRLVVLEVWDSVEAHQVSAQAIPPETLQQARALLAAPPTGAYYTA